MTPKIISAVAISNYDVLLTYETNEKRIFNVEPYLHLGGFSDLKNESMFKTVKISFDTIEWSNGLDIDPEDLYKNSKLLTAKSIA